jgi:hypothetical protein
MLSYEPLRIKIGPQITRMTQIKNLRFGGSLRNLCNLWIGNPFITMSGRLVTKTFRVTVVS